MTVGQWTALVALATVGAAIGGLALLTLVAWLANWRTDRLVSELRPRRLHRRGL